MNGRFTEIVCESSMPNDAAGLIRFFQIFNLLFGQSDTDTTYRTVSYDRDDGNQEHKPMMSLRLSKLVVPMIGADTPACELVKRDNRSKS
jgi:hypothetical protein